MHVSLALAAKEHAYQKSWPTKARRDMVVEPASHLNSIRQWLLRPPPTPRAQSLSRCQTSKQYINKKGASVASRCEVGFFSLNTGVACTPINCAGLLEIYYSNIRRANRFRVLAVSLPTPPPTAPSKLTADTSMMNVEEEDRDKDILSQSTASRSVPVDPVEVPRPDGRERQADTSRPGALRFSLLAQHHAHHSQVSVDDEPWYEPASYHSEIPRSSNDNNNDLTLIEATIVNDASSPIYEAVPVSYRNTYFCCAAFIVLLRDYSLFTISRSLARV